VNASPLALVADPAFAALRDQVIERTGLGYYADKDLDLASRLAGRLARRGLRDCAAYLALVQGAQGGDELDELIKDLTVGETFFFRHPELFDALRNVVLPDLISRNRPHRRLRIWSAGCATGAEPYSLSILLRRDLADTVAGWDISIVATDINRAFLARAREGVFDDWALRATPEEVRRDCFCRAGRAWALEPRFQEGVCFQYHNLVTDPYPSLLHNLSALDLILCRNVMIYFSPDLMRRVVAGLRDSLVEGGWLLVGHAEPNVALFRAFRTVNAPGAVLYQKVVRGESSVSAALPSIPDASPPLRTPLTTDPASDLECGEASPLWLSLSGLGEKRSQTESGDASPHSKLLTLTEVRTLADAGAWEQALAACDALLGADPLDSRAHFYRGLVLEQTGRHTEAERSLRRALYLDRRFALAHYYLGLLLQKAGQLPRAARSFRNVLTLLARLDAKDVLAEADGLTAAALARLTRAHLIGLEEA
jgi:chemotaxis protein methyltransferase CheR